MIWADLLFDLPPRSAVTFWKRAAGVQRPTGLPKRCESEEAEAVHDRIVFDLPEKRQRLLDQDPPNGSGDEVVAKKGKDPLKMLMALDVCKYLEAVQDFSEAGTAWENFGRGYEAPRNTSQDPSRASLQRARQKVDIVAMLLERREYRAAVVSGRLLALNIYTDASPVMGVEIQGLVVDLIFKDRAMERVVMPGGTLSYGRCGAMNKTAALLYSLWLLFGPDEEMLRRVLLLVRTITTDFGVEMGTVDSPDFLKAWFARLGGAAPDICRSMVDCHTRLFPMCLRISGWSHAWGNLMKSIAKSCQQWPRILDASRSLCRFSDQRVGGHISSFAWQVAQSI
jgi:hypothetical protein